MENHNQQEPAYTPGGDTSVMSTKDFLLTLLVLLIPCVNIILYMVWAFGSEGNVNRKNFCRAYLLFSLIGIAISIFIFFTMSAMIVGIASSYM